MFPTQLPSRSVEDLWYDPNDPPSDPPPKSSTEFWEDDSKSVSGYHQGRTSPTNKQSNTSNRAQAEDKTHALASSAIASISSEFEGKALSTDLTPQEQQQALAVQQNISGKTATQTSKYINQGSIDKLIKRMWDRKQIRIEEPWKVITDANRLLFFSNINSSEINEEFQTNSTSRLLDSLKNLIDNQLLLIKTKKSNQQDKVIVAYSHIMRNYVMMLSIVVINKIRTLSENSPIQSIILNGEYEKKQYSTMESAIYDLQDFEKLQKVSYFFNLFIKEIKNFHKLTISKAIDNLLMTEKSFLDLSVVFADLVLKVLFPLEEDSTVSTRKQDKKRKTRDDSTEEFRSDNKTPRQNVDDISFPPAATHLTHRVGSGEDAFSMGEQLQLQQLQLQKLQLQLLHKHKENELIQELLKRDYLQELEQLKRTMQFQQIEQLKMQQKSKSELSQLKIILKDKETILAWILQQYPEVMQQWSLQLQLAEQQHQGQQWQMPHQRQIQQQQEQQWQLQQQRLIQQQQEQQRQLQQQWQIQQQQEQQRQLQQQRQIQPQQQQRQIQPQQEQQWQLQQQQEQQRQLQQQRHIQQQQQPPQISNL